MIKGIVLSIINHKGGVGKTATTCNLGHALARIGKRVLTVDMDLQCNTTATLYGSDRPRYSLYELLDPEISENEIIEKCIYGTSYENLYIVPNIPETAAIEQRIIKRYPEGLQLFRDKLRTYVKKNFDFILIDNPPNLGTFVLCSLMATDFVIVPSETGSKYSMEGLNEAVSFIEDIRENQNEELRFLKVLLTKVDQRMIVHKVSISQIRNFYPKEKVFKTMIPTNTAVQQAEMLGITIFKHRSNAAAAIAYSNLAKEVIKTIGVLKKNN